MWDWDAVCSAGRKIDNTIREDATGKIKEYAPYILPSPEVARTYATGISIGIAKYAAAEILRVYTGGMPVARILAEINRSSGQLFQREEHKITEELENLKFKQLKIEEMMISREEMMIMRQEVMLRELLKLQQSNMVLTSRLAELKQSGRAASNVQQPKKAERFAATLLSHLEHAQLKQKTNEWNFLIDRNNLVVIYLRSCRL